MKDQETIQKFIELRTKNVSFQRIADQLGVAQSTLILWSREHQHLIQNLRAIEWEDFVDRTLASKQERLKALSEQLRRLPTGLGLPRRNELKAGPISVRNSPIPLPGQTLPGLPRRCPTEPGLPRRNEVKSGPISVRNSPIPLPGQNTTDNRLQPRRASPIQGSPCLG